jgi:multicomponent Na+:H+ antiporter subunit C
MEMLLVLIVGVLFAAAVYLLLEGNLLRMVFGLILLSNAANVLFFTAGRVTRGSPPLIPVGAEAPAAAVANPLAQALVLTAIVIGFGLLCFTLVLVYRSYRTFGTLEVGAAASEPAPAELHPGDGAGDTVPPVPAITIPTRSLSDRPWTGFYRRRF